MTRNLAGEEVALAPVLTLLDVISASQLPQLPAARLMLSGQFFIGGFQRLILRRKLPLNLRCLYIGRERGESE